MKTEEIVYSVTGYFDNTLSTRYFKTIEESVLAVAFLATKGYNSYCDGIIGLVLSLDNEDKLTFNQSGSTWVELTSNCENVRVKGEVECI